MKNVSNYASALGEAVGKLIEESLIRGIEEEVVSRNYTIAPYKLRNGSSNVYQIDAVIFDVNNNPVLLLESKYIRYKKHNRDKASWLCVAHHSLRKTYPTIRKSIAVLAGNWSAPSKSLLRSFGVDIIELPFEKIVETFASHNIQFNWPEKDRETPKNAWNMYSQFDQATQRVLATELTNPIREQIRNRITETLDANLEDIQQRISEVEVLLKTNRGEMVLETFDSVSASLQGLMKFVVDKPNMDTELS